MMMSDDKKKQATLIVAKMKGMPAEKPTTEAGDEMDHSSGYMAAAEEMMAAIEKKDPTMFKDALKSFVDMCSMEEPEAEETAE